MKACEVAKHIINYCISIDNPISNLQLQKMLYFVDMNHLINTNRRLITDLNFSAWDYGPVIVEVYKKYAKYGHLPLREWEDTEEDLPSERGGQIYGYIDKLSKIYPSILVEESHKKGTPWDSVYNNGNKYGEITTELMMEYADEYRERQ